jgi:hypothetical protein
MLRLNGVSIQRSKYLSRKIVQQLIDKAPIQQQEKDDVDSDSDCDDEVETAGEEIDDENSYNNQPMEVEVNTETTLFENFLKDLENMFTVNRFQKGVAFRGKTPIPTQRITRGQMNNPIVQQPQLSQTRLNIKYLEIKSDWSVYLRPLHRLLVTLEKETATYDKKFPKKVRESTPSEKPTKSTVTVSQ